MELVIAIIIFAIIGPIFYRAMDRLEDRIRKNWKDTWYKRLILLGRNPVSPTKKPGVGG